MQPDLQPDTAARERARKKREEEARWAKILAMYMMQQWEEKKQKELEEIRSKLDFRAFFRELKKDGESQAERLLRKEPGKLNSFELLQEMDRYQEADSPFRRLYQTMLDRPEAGQEIDDAVADCVRVAPQRILDREKRRRERMSMGGKPDPDRDAGEERRLQCEMTFLRSVMPAALYAELCRELTRQGRITDPDKDFQYIADPEARSDGYAAYVARHSVDPSEKAGRLGNSDAVFTAAAYMLAAWEQKGAERFDEKRADARAMVLFGSKAFLSYMKEHPGALLAAARNIGVEVTHDEVITLDAKLRQRDDRLRGLRDNLRLRASGKSAAYYQMMNGLDRFLKSAEEPSREQQETLVRQLAAYAVTEGDPKHPDYDRDAALQSIAAARELCSSRDFSLLLDTVNRQRGENARIRPEDLDAAARPKEPEIQPEPPGPELRLSR